VIKLNREDFEILKNNIIYFDNGATTLKSNAVSLAIMDYYNNYTANIHRGDYALSHKVSDMYDKARLNVKNFIGANHYSEIIFTKGTTEGLNDIVFGYFKHKLSKNDEVLITLSEHASNILPWFVLEKEIGIKVKYIPLDEKNEIDMSKIESVITKKTKVISIAHVTNVIGDVRDIKEISKIAHKYNCLMVVDAAQSIAHCRVDVVDMDIDFMAFSGHKMYGPTGIGVLYGKFDLLKDLVPIEYGGGMNAIFNKDGYIELKDLPDRLEAGTPNIEGVIGLNASIEYINNVGLDKINKYEHELRDYLIKKLSELDFIELYNRDNYSTSVAFNIKGVFSQDTALYLDKYHICVRAGNHCAKILNNVFNINNTCRITLSFYNTYEEIDLLINVLKNSSNIWKEIL